MGLNVRRGVLVWSFISVLGMNMASSEPMKKRTQLKHLDGAPDAKAMALSPIAGGTEPSFQAEAKGGDGAEVMSFK